MTPRRAPLKPPPGGIAAKTLLRVYPQKPSLEARFDRPTGTRDARRAAREREQEGTHAEITEISAVIETALCSLHVNEFFDSSSALLSVLASCPALAARRCRGGASCARSGGQKMARRDREEWGALADSEEEDIDLGEEPPWTLDELTPATAAAPGKAGGKAKGTRVADPIMAYNVVRPTRMHHPSLRPAMRACACVIHISQRYPRVTEWPSSSTASALFSHTVFPSARHNRLPCSGPCFPTHSRALHCTCRERVLLHWPVRKQPRLRRQRTCPSGT
jgi:hypothetical protein